MAVQKMCFVTLIGPIDQFDAVVERGFRSYQFHPENALEVLRDVKGLFPFTTSNPYEAPLRNVQETMELLGIAPCFQQFEGCEPSLSQVEDLCCQTRKEVRQLLDKQKSLQERRTQLQRMLLQLQPLEQADVDLDALFHMEYIKFRFGRMPMDSYDKFQMYLSENQMVLYVPTWKEEHFMWGFYFVPRHQTERIDSLFGSLHFERHTLPKEAHGSPGQAIAVVNQRLQEVEQSLAQLETQLTACGETHRSPLLTAYCMLRSQHDIFQIRRYSAHSRKNFYLTGWLPAEDAACFEGQFENDPLISCLVENTGEVESVVTPPTRLRNCKLFQPFEDFVQMYGLPSYGEVDPTPLLAISYILLFGIMFGDLGQGFLLVLLGLVLAWKGFSLGRIISTVGCSSMVFGCVYGSVFGYEHLLPWGGFKALEDAAHINLTLGVSIGLGALLISFAMLVNIYNGIRQKNMEKVLFHTSGVAGFIFYWGVIYAVLGLFGFGSSVISPLYVVLVIALPLLLIYLREPLGRLVSRQKDWKPHSWSSYLLEGFFELLETVLSYATNTISFMRVGAFALNHAGMMLAVFILSRMFGGSENLVVVIVGNLFVMCMEGLIVGIQVLRLEFYELFGRFFGGEGKPFAPFAIRYHEKNI
ncbi:MAG: V-type ATP synthase subunit I [Eubacteriales bacterium]|jgi:V/A-type H+-transporting ATPase subunit I